MRFLRKLHIYYRDGLVAQLVRALACHARGRGFEPHPSRHSYASVAQLVEQGTENPRVVGSIPTGGTISADLAHLVERHLAKVEVAGSSPVIRSKNKRQTARVCFLFLETPYGAAPRSAALSPAKTALAVLVEITAQKSAGISVITLCFGQSLRLLFVFGDSLRCCAAPNGASPAKTALAVLVELDCVSKITLRKAPRDF